MGEGYHNFHHAFPYHYSASELGWQNNFNPATAFIDACSWLGLAYDLRTVPDEMVEKRVARTGDKSAGWKRKQLGLIDKLWDFLLGLIYVTWPLWFSFTFRWCYWRL